LAAQTRLPDELIVCDDVSTDDTVAVLERFKREAPFPVEIHVNEANVGFIANFDRAIGFASGDVIALCDQDDVWLPEKLALIESVVARRADVGLVFSNGDVVDDELKPLNQSLFEYAEFTRGRQSRLQRGNAFDVLLDANVVTGATMAFRAQVRDIALPIPLDTGRYHDSWVALIAAATMRAEFLPERLIQYRQHQAQVTGVRKSDRPAVLSRDHYREHVEFLSLVDSRLASAPQSPSIVESRRRLADRLAHVDARASMPTGLLARVLVIARELLRGHYGKYSNGLRSVARDLIGP
jgi:glycosyltransferase involved in cell wall biosynthesis